jgi:hypothetical protein
MKQQKTDQNENPPAGDFIELLTSKVNNIKTFVTY